MGEVFHIVPPGPRTAAMLLPLVGVLIVVGVFIGLSLRGARASTFELSPAGLRIRGDLYGRAIALGDLDERAARVVNLDEERALGPKWRTLGTALPGYRSGWFRLRNGEKALLYLTDTRRAVYVPTRDGYSLLLSVDRPEAFVERLRALAGG